MVVYVYREKKVIAASWHTESCFVFFYDLGSPYSSRSIYCCCVWEYSWLVVAWGSSCLLLCLESAVAKEKETINRQ